MSGMGQSLSLIHPGTKVSILWTSKTRKQAKNIFLTSSRTLTSIFFKFQHFTVCSRHFKHSLKCSSKFAAHFECHAHILVICHGSTDYSHKIKTLAPWKESYDKPRQCIKRQRHHFVNKGLYSRSYGFSSSCVLM